MQSLANTKRNIYIFNIFTFVHLHFTFNYKSNTNMDFSLSKSIEILERTPNVLITMLENIDAGWTLNNEGTDTWSVYDIVGHLIEGEKSDWVPRMEIILSNKPDKSFVPFNRFAQFEESKGQSLVRLLAEFKKLREKNLAHLRSKDLTNTGCKQTGLHPAFGEITLSQLLATWTVHDLNHIAQISRVMARQYQEAVGPWTAYLKILQA